MPAMQHVYTTLHGEWTSGPFLGEHAQIGVRAAFVPLLTSPIAGETFEMLLNGDVVPDFGTTAGTNGVLTKTWKARVGQEGSLENWGDSEQIAFAEAARTFADTVQTLQVSAFEWTHAKQAAIAADGTTAGTASTYTFNSPLAGTSTGPLPAQCAFAVSTRANIVGQRGRGRVYLPALKDSFIDDTGIATAASMTTARDAMKVWIDDMQSALGGLDLYRALYVITSAGQDTAVRPVEVRTGDQIDVIRSRRAQVPENYVSLTL